jgi:hypothetical protein
METSHFGCWGDLVGGGEKDSSPEEPLKSEEEYEIVDKTILRKKEGSESLEQQPKASSAAVVG